MSDDLHRHCDRDSDANGAAIAVNAIRSVLDQPVENVSLLVSDNSTSERDRESLGIKPRGENLFEFTTLDDAIDYSENISVGNISKQGNQIGTASFANDEARTKFGCVLSLKTIPGRP